MLVEEHLVKVEHQKDIKFSIIIPAHNEEKYLGKCLDSIEAASKLYKEQLEIIVVLNRCSDKTEEIAKSRNCITVQNNDKNLSKIRNCGAAIARGEIIVTIDADTQMMPHVLSTIDERLSSGKYIGGGMTGLRINDLNIESLMKRVCYLNVLKNI